jgi:Holliday junction resolvasome RuvABC ATP-dependent DNA helicase subunit
MSGAVNAEDFSLDSVSKGQTSKTVQSGANGVTDVNSTAVQGSLTDTLVKKLGISSEQAQGGPVRFFS